MLTAEELQSKYFKPEEHPYKIYENKIASVLRTSDTILDAGCGRAAPILRNFIGKAKVLIGVDLEDPVENIPDIIYKKCDISSIDIQDNSVNLVISRAVLEHVIDPNSVFKEINRILTPGGSFVFLVPNLYDYVSLISLLIPNKFHQSIVSKTEGRKIDDVFPAYYKSNTYTAIKQLCAKNGFKIIDFQWLGQYPSSFMFSSILFVLATIYEKMISRFECLRYLRGWLLVQIIKE